MSYFSMTVRIFHCLYKQEVQGDDICSQYKKRRRILGIIRNSYLFKSFWIAGCCLVIGLKLIVCLWDLGL